MEQWRIAGRVHILPNPDHPLTASFPTQRLAPEGEGEGEGVAFWEKERMKTFNEKIGETLRAWWCRPMAPGSKMGSYDDLKEYPEKLPKTYEVDAGDEQMKHWMEEAVKHFALLVMEPTTVERVEFNPRPNRRTKFEKQGDEWVESILAP